MLVYDHLRWLKLHFDCYQKGGLVDLLVGWFFGSLLHKYEYLRVAFLPLNMNHYQGQTRVFCWFANTVKVFWVFALRFQSGGVKNVNFYSVTGATFICSSKGFLHNFRTRSNS